MRGGLTVCVLLRTNDNDQSPHHCLTIHCVTALSSLSCLGKQQLNCVRFTWFYDGADQQDIDLMDFTINYTNTASGQTFLLTTGRPAGTANCGLSVVLLDCGVWSVSSDSGLWSVNSYGGLWCVVFQ